MEHKDHKELWDKINDMQSHINLCEVERARMQKDIEEAKSDKVQASAWSMKIFSILAGFIFTLGGAGIKMFSDIQSQAIQIERLDWDTTKALNFVAEWPTGKLGKLPDDNVQNTKLDDLEYKVKELQSQINRLYQETVFKDK